MLSSNKNKGPSRNNNKNNNNKNNNNNEGGDVDGINAVMLLDRLVSASTSADVLESLEGLERGLSSKKGNNNNNNNTNNNNNNNSSQELAHSLVSLNDESPDNDKVLTVFWKLLHRDHILLRDDPDQAQDGVLWTCRILLQLLSMETERAAKTLLQEPAPGRILEALMDVVVADQVDPDNEDDDDDNVQQQSPTTTLSPYVRVLACQGLHRLCTLQPSLAQTQLLRAPNGLHRLGDLLRAHTDEQVRNQALLLAATLAEWPSVAQVWIFSNLAEGLLELATTLSDYGDGGLTNGPVLVQDCCAILHNLVTHANPQMAAELLLASPSFGRNMTLLLDLRQGQQFLHPETVNNNKASSSSKSASKHNSSNKLSRSQEDDGEDDLDDLIKSSAHVGKKSAAGDNGFSDDTPVIVPRLLASEEIILRSLLDIWLILLQDQLDVQQMAWRQHTGALRMIWEMALLSPPPTPQTPYPCAMPSIALQQYALHVVAQVLVPVSITEMDRDRLLYLTCTGGLGTTRQDRYRISQAALHVLRQAAISPGGAGVLTLEMMAFALAPPPPPVEDEDGNNNDPAAAPPPLPEQALVVPKLLSTIQQNLPFRNSDSAAESQLEDDMHVVGLVGSTSALSLFLQNDVSRSMLLKLIQKQQQELIPMDRGTGDTFIDQLLQRLDHDATAAAAAMDSPNNNGMSNNNNNESLHRDVAACLLRFLATWCTQSPEVVYAVLSSPHATVLSNVYNQTTGTTNNSSSKAGWAIPQLAGLVLGTALANLQDEEQAAGWTRETLLQILTRRQTTVLQPKLVGSSSMTATATLASDAMDAGLPWSYSSFELSVYREWNKATLLVARQAMVQYLTTSANTTTTANTAAGELDSQSDHSASSHSEANYNSASSLIHEVGGGSAAALSQMVAQQTMELENLRSELTQAQLLVAQKDKELASVRLRVESAPSELDNLVKETAQQNSQLQQRIQELENRDSETQSALVQMQQKLEAANAEKDEALQQAETLTQDVESMTESYSNLEQEYQRQQESLAQLQEQKSTDQTEATEAYSAEVVMLRAENNRLREAARSADSWMKMAVERFKTMEQEKVSLQQKITSLEKEVSSGGGALAVREQELQQQHAAAMEALQEQMQQQLDEVQNELDRLVHDLDSARSRHEEERDELQTRVEDLKNKFDSAMSAHEEERDELQTRIEDLQQQVSTQQQALAKANSSNTAETQQLRDELAALQNELQQTLQLKDEQLSQYEATVEELQSRLSSDSAAADEIRSRDEEIEQLRASNDAAQEWMAKAVEHHNLLSGQVTSLTTEIDELKAQNKELQDKLLPFEASARLTEQMEKDLEEQSAQVEQLTVSLQQKEEELQDHLTRHIAEVDQLKASLEAAQQQHQEATLSSTGSKDEMIALRAEMGQKTEQVEQLLREKQSLHDKYNEVNTRACDLDMEVAELKAELQEAVEDKETLETKTRELEQRVQELQQQEVLQTRVHELEDEKARLVQEMEQSVTAKDEEIRQLTERCALLGEQCTNLEERCREAESRSSLEHESQQTPGERRSEANEAETVQELEAQLTHLREEMDSQEREAASVIAEWQESYSSVEARCSELQSRVTELESSCNNNSLDGDANLQSRIQELQQLMDEKDRQAAAVVAQWQASYEYLQNENSELQSRIEILSRDNPGSATTTPDDLSQNNAEISNLKREIEELKDQVIQATDNSSKFEAEYNAATLSKRALEAQLATMSHEYNDIVGQDEEHQRKISALERKVKELESSLSNSNEIGEQHAARVRELESELESKLAELAGEESEADQVIQEWQESYNDLQKEKVEIEKKMEALSLEHDTALSEREQYHARVLELESKLHIFEVGKAESVAQASRISLLESKLQEKEQELDKIAHESSSATALQEKNRALDDELTALRSRMDSVVSALEEARFKKEEDRAKIVELEAGLRDAVAYKAKLEDALERISELETELRTTEERFAADSLEADEIIAQWKESHDELESAKAELETRLGKMEEELREALASKDEYVSMAEQLQADLRDAQSSVDLDQLTKLQGEKAALESQMESLAAEKDAALAQITTREEEARSKIQELEEALQMKTEELEKDAQDADDVIRQWQESYELVVAEKTEAEARLESVSTQLEEAKVKHDEDIRQWQEKYDLAVAEKVTTGTSVESISAQLQEAQAKHERDIRQWQENHDALVAEKSEAESRLESIAKQMETAEDQHKNEIKQWQERYGIVVTQKSEAEYRLEALSKQLEETQAERDNYNSLWLEKYNALLAEKNNLESLFGSVSKQFESLKAKNEEFLNEMANQKKVLAEKDSALYESKKLLAHVQAELEKSEQKGRDVEVSVQDLQQKLDSLTDENGTAQDRIQNFQKAIEEFKDQEADTKELVQKLEDDRKNHHERAEALETELKHTEKQLADLKNELAGLQEKLKESESINSTLEARLKTIVEERDGLLQSSAVEIERLKEQLDDAKKDDSARITELQQELKASETRLLEHESTNKELKAKCQALEDLSSKIANSLDAARTEHATKESSFSSEIETLRDALEENIIRVRELEEALAGEVEQADEAIQQWQDSYDALLVEKEELESELNSLRSSKIGEDTIERLTAELEATKALLETRDAEHQELLESYTASLSLFDEQKASYDEEMELLRLKAIRFEEQANSSVESLDLLKVQYNELNVAKQEVEQELLSMTRTLEDVQRKLEKADADDEQREIVFGEGQRPDQEYSNDANDVNQVDLQLNTSTSGLDEDGVRSFHVPDCEGSGYGCNASSTPPPTTISSNLQVELESEREARKTETDRCMKLELEHEVHKTESDRLIRSWRGEAEEFGKLLQNTRVELENHRKEAKEIISRLEARCSELEAKCSNEGEICKTTQSDADSLPRSLYDNEVATRKKAEGEVAVLKKMLQEKEEEVVGLKRKIGEAEVLTARLESALSEQEEKSRDRDAQRTIENDRFVALERDFEDLRQKHASLEDERDALRVTVAELEGEVKEAFDGLQFHLTNEISEQATKVAADALRRQVDDMRHKAEMDGSALQTERAARLAAEQEVKRLRSDLAAIFGMEDCDKNQNEILRRTAEATERFQRTEKAEIQELKSTLEHILSELESTRAVLEETEHRANVSELRSAQLEQDLVTAKSDLELLSQMMEDMRDSESSKRLAMENRISGFEDEQNVIRRLHEAEMENMRNLLEQTSMEKDSLLQSLKDSEKSKEALLHASSRGRDPDSDQNAGVELIRLRMEKAHLLAAASQEASRTERRIRELREAAKSSAEADLLVERELRAAAELALENATSELRDVRSKLAAEAAAASQRGSNLHELECELKKLKDTVKCTTDDNNNLRRQLDDLKQSSQQTIAKLRDEVKSAKVKALQSERAVRHEAEVRAELARLHGESAPEAHGISGSPSSHIEQSYVGDSHISNLYDLIEQQRNTIKEQREAHSSLENDFEGLLALLAQSKLVEESLSAALGQTGGEKAVSDAITKAEEKAIAQYGTFVRVGD